MRAAGREDNRWTVSWRAVLLEEQEEQQPHAALRRSQAQQAEGRPAARMRGKAAQSEAIEPLSKPTVATSGPCANEDR